MRKQYFFFGSAFLASEKIFPLGRFRFLGKGHIGASEKFRQTEIGFLGKFLVIRYYPGFRLAGILWAISHSRRAFVLPVP